MIRHRIPLMLLLLATVAAFTALAAPAEGDVLGTHDRTLRDAMAHGNSPGDLGAQHPDTPISAPLDDPWSFAWELEVTDFAAPHHGAVDWITDAGPQVEGFGATPAPTPVPAPGGLVLISLAAAMLAGRVRLRRRGS